MILLCKIYFMRAPARNTVRTHLPEKRELFGKIKAARGADG